VAGAQPSRSVASQIRHRKSVTSLNPEDLTNLRDAITKMLAISDDRGFEHWAGIHGLPLPMYCHHGDLLFLPWHRAYLYFFEQYLMDQVAAARLPWWDWTDQKGVPAAFAVAQLDGGGANPLASAPISGIPDSQFKAEAVPKTTTTFRRTKAPSTLPSPALVNQILSLSSFDDFSMQVEDQLHNRVHVWTGGTMGLIPLAAYDPLFWAHHTMVDRLWWLWQLRHPGAGPDPSMLHTALAPFPNITVAQTLDVTSLGYDYAVSADSTTPPQP
jgi:tyrosinase